MTLDASRQDVLGREDCIALMTAVPIGRIVFTEAALPAVQPVTFVIDDESVIIRTDEGSRLAAATRNAVVAFETDSFDAETRTGWSVTVVGHALAVDDKDESARLKALPMHPWEPGRRDHYIRVRIEYITGRRIIS
jgi:uncharacterized protein